MAFPGKLYLVSVPIGNRDDLSTRAVRVLGAVDEIVCEERRNGSTLLKQLGLQVPLSLLNEHNEEENIPRLLEELRRGQSLALISDAGTPVFADPGLELVRGATKINAQIIPIPGASSLMAALVCSGFSLQQFYFAGFLPRKSKERLARLKELHQIRTTLVILETPYRLNPVLQDALKVFSNSTPTVLCMNLTQKDEQFHRRSLKKMLEHFEQFLFRGEFVLLLDNSPSVTSLQPGSRANRSRKK